MMNERNYNGGRMIYVHKEFLFPFGLDEELLPKMNGFLSRWTITGEHRNGYTCYDKYYRKYCYYMKRNGSSVMVYDWNGQFEPYELARFATINFNTDIIKNAPLIEIFPNRWDDPRVRVLYNGNTKMEIYFTQDGKILTPYAGEVSSLNKLKSMLEKINRNEIILSNGFEVYKTLDAEKPYRIVHKNGQYFIVKNGIVQSHIPFGRKTTIDRIRELLVT